MRKHSSAATGRLKPLRLFSTLLTDPDCDCDRLISVSVHHELYGVPSLLMASEPLWTLKYSSDFSIRQVSFLPVKGSVGICFIYPADTSSDKEVGVLLKSSVNCSISLRSTKSASRRDASFRNCCLWEQPILPLIVVNSRNTINARYMFLTLNKGTRSLIVSCM